MEMQSIQSPDKLTLPLNMRLLPFWEVVTKVLTRHGGVRTLLGLPNRVSLSQHCSIYKEIGHDFCSSIEYKITNYVQKSQQ